MRLANNIRSFRRYLCPLLIAGALVTPAAATDRSSATITDLVARSGGDFDHNRRDFDILLNAVLTAGLDSALADPAADLTVFAPNDAAFIRLARDLGYAGYDEAGAFGAIVDALTDIGGGDPIPVLTNVLLYHVSPDAKTYRQIRHVDVLDTLLPGTIATRRGKLFDADPDFRNPRILRYRSNIRASNGIIHTISRVLIPVDLPNDNADKPSITGIVAASGNDFDRNFWDYDILLQAVLAAGLDGALDAADADLTVFAPSDIAFIRLARSLGYRRFDEAGSFNFIVSALTELGDGDPIPLLTNILLYHVSPSAKTVRDVVTAESISTLLDGVDVEPNGFSLMDNDPGLRDPRVLTYASDVRANNGLIHTINRVLIPLNVTGAAGH